MEKLLFLYSSPADADRLRLDKEHRIVDAFIRGRQAQPYELVRKHATTLKDIADAFAGSSFTVFHFSGHGSAQGIFLESEHHDKGELFAAERISSLLQRTQPNLKLAVFMSCFSAESIPILANVAPYLLTVSGSISDSRAIEFVESFYRYFLTTGSISKACRLAQEISGAINVVLSRRENNSKQSKTFYEVFPLGDHSGDSFLVDLSDAENDIGKLGVRREAFLDVLTRKIRLHHRIFDSPRENAVLPVGPYVGVFSWRNAKDRILCHRILKIKAGIAQAESDAWTSLAIDYNDLANQSYRTSEEPASPANKVKLEIAISNFKGDFKFIFGENVVAVPIQKLVPDQFKSSQSNMLANLRMAEQKIQEPDYVLTVFHLESALSALHDLLTALTETVTLN